MASVSAVSAARVAPAGTPPPATPLPPSDSGWWEVAVAGNSYQFSDAKLAQQCLAYFSRHSATIRAVAAPNAEIARTSYGFNPKGPPYIPATQTGWWQLQTQTGLSLAFSDGARLGACIDALRKAGESFSITSSRSPDAAAARSPHSVNPPGPYYMPPTTTGWWQVSGRGGTWFFDDPKLAWECWTILKKKNVGPQLTGAGVPPSRDPALVNPTGPLYLPYSQWGGWQLSAMGSTWLFTDRAKLVKAAEHFDAAGEPFSVSAAQVNAQYYQQWKGMLDPVGPPYLPPTQTGWWSVTPANGQQILFSDPKLAWACREHFRAQGQQVYLQAGYVPAAGAKGVNPAGPPYFPTSVSGWWSIMPPGYQLPILFDDPKLAQACLDYFKGLGTPANVGAYQAGAAGAKGTNPTGAPYLPHSPSGWWQITAGGANYVFSDDKLAAALLAHLQKAGASPQVYQSNSNAVNYGGMIVNPTAPHFLPATQSGWWQFTIGTGTFWFNDAKLAAGCRDTMSARGQQVRIVAGGAPADPKDSAVVNPVGPYYFPATRSGWWLMTVNGAQWYFNDRKKAEAFVDYWSKLRAPITVQESAQAPSNTTLGVNDSGPDYLPYSQSGVWKLYAGNRSWNFDDKNLLVRAMKYHAGLNIPVRVNAGPPIDPNMRARYPGGYNPPGPLYN